jgi:hypothetical protein
MQSKVATVDKQTTSTTPKITGCMGSKKKRGSVGKLRVLDYEHVYYEPQAW